MCLPPPPILQLDDFILSHIFRQLSLLDLCSIAETCVRFNDVIQSIVRHRYETFHYINELYAIGIETEPLDLHLIAKTIGPQVKCLRVDLDQRFSEPLNNVIDNYCCSHLDRVKNLTYTLNNVKKFDSFLEMIPKHFSKLIEIQIGFLATHTPIPISKDSDCSRLLTVLDVHITDAQLQNIHRHYPFQAITIDLPELQKEDNREWSGLKGTFLQTMTGIRTLTLRQCRRIKPQYFYDFCLANAETMQHFECIDCDYLEENPVTFEQIGKCLKHLESFRLTPQKAEPNLMCLAGLAKLKELRLYMVTDIEPLICRLAAIDCLERLELVDCLVDFPTIVDEITFTKLKHLNVKGCSVDGDVLAQIGRMNKSLIELHFDHIGGADPDEALLALLESSVHLKTLDLMCVREMISLDYFREICHVLATSKEREKLCLRLATHDYSKEQQMILMKIGRIAKENSQLSRMVVVDDSFVVLNL